MLFFDNEGDEVGHSIAQGSKILALRYEGQPFIREDADGYALSLDAVLAEAELHQPQKTAFDFVATTPTATTDIDLLLTEARYFAEPASRRRTRKWFLPRLAGGRRGLPTQLRGRPWPEAVRRVLPEESPSTKATTTSPRSSRISTSTTTPHRPPIQHAIGPRTGQWRF